MRKLLRSQMKNVIGGLNASDDEGGNCACKNGTAGSGESCHTTTKDCAKKCDCGVSCKDRGNELGSVCQ